jgi:DNA-binding NarL/FixJ family response regulator
MKVFVAVPDPIYRRGLIACLEDVAEAESVADADEADVVLVDNDLDDAHNFIRTLREGTGARVVVCSARSDQRELQEALAAGAVGYLWKETLTPDALVASLRTAATGSGVLAPDLLRSLATTQNEGLSLSPLTVREQQVLRLVADGHPTREVAKRLSYSERTVKNVIHDVVTKFNARSRSQAVAAAVREGLI